MARLPKPGGDTGQWAGILNDYLQVAHDDTGQLRPQSVGLSQLKTAPAGTARSIQNKVLTNNGRELLWESAAAVLPAASNPITVNVADFGAKGDGVTDDTDAIQAAINAANGGGSVEFPKGIFMVRQLKVGVSGTTLIGTARLASRLVRIGGTQPLLDISGTLSVNGHIRYCALQNIQISGNGLPGVLLRSYFADTCVYRDVSFIHCAGVATDIVEMWDTRFYDCSWEDCGSLTDPAMLIRNTLAPGNFGFGNDNSNQLHFLGCRWEGFRNGAVRLDGAANGSTSKLNGMFFVSSKMESSVAAGSAFQIADGCTVVFIDQLYIAIMATDPNYSGVIDAVEDHGTHIYMAGVYVQWGSSVPANSAIHMVSGAPHTYFKIGTFYPNQDPITATIVVEPAATQASVTTIFANRGLASTGQFGQLVRYDSHIGLSLPMFAPSAFVLTDATTSRDIFKVDYNSTRPALITPNGTDAVGFSDAYATEKWRLVSSTGAARFASGKFQIEATKGYGAINTTPFTNIAFLIKAAAEGDRGLAIVRPTSTATNRLLEFQDETYNIQGMAIDSNGRPLAVGTPPRVTAGDQASYANPRVQVRDMAGGISAAVKPSPTAPGVIAIITFSRAFVAAPLSIILFDHSQVSGDLYVSARDATSFTVSTRSSLRGGSILSFDYVVVG